MSKLRKILEELVARARLGIDTEADYFSVNIAHQQILALIPKKREPMPEEKEYKSKYRDSNLMTAGFNKALSEMEQSMTGEK